MTGRDKHAGQTAQGAPTETLVTAILRQQRVLNATHRPARGDAVTLVFSNSLGTDLRLWDEVIPHLPDAFGLLRCDTAGHGLSSGGAGLAIGDHADDLAALIERFVAGRFVLVGLSMGGLIAQTLAARGPARLAGVVLSNTGLRIGTPEMWRARIDQIAAGGLAAIAEATMERWFSPAFRSERPDDLALWRTMLARQPADGYCALAGAIAEADCTPAAAAIRVPALCLAGSADTATPPDVVAALAAAIPGARLVVLDGVGHLPPVEAPREMAPAILRFLDETLAELPSGAPAADPLETGLATRRAVLGAAHVARAQAAQTAFDARFQELITRGAWGTVWSGTAISRRERSMLTIALLAALGHDEELAMHCRATRRTGASADDIREALLHVAIYAGVPAANSAFRVARAALAEAEAEAGAGPAGRESRDPAGPTETAQSEERKAQGGQDHG